MVRAGAEHHLGSAHGHLPHLSAFWQPWAAVRQLRGHRMAEQLRTQPPGKPPLNDAEAKVIEDIENCNLPAVSWAIPDGSWSDHGGYASDFKGPFWAAAIVNSI